MSVRSLKIVQNPLNTFRTTWFRTSAWSKAAIMDMERKFSNSTFDWYRFHHGWTSVCPTLHVWKCLQRAVFATYAHRWQKAVLRSTKIRVNFQHLFSTRNKRNNTVRKTRHEAFLNSNFYWDWIKNIHELRQWKSLKLDQLSYVKHSREHFGLPIISHFQSDSTASMAMKGLILWSFYQK